MIYILGIILLAADRITKIWANTTLSQMSSIEFIKGVLGFSYVENTGVAFGMLADKMHIMIPVTFVIICVCAYIFIRYRNKNKLFDISMLLIIIGAVGNLMDKITRGFVVDFIEFLFIDFPVFNMADIYVCTGAGLLMLYVLFFSDGEKNDNKK